MGNLRSFRSPKLDPSRGIEHNHKRGWPWLVAAVFLCPCHLPFTLSVVGGAFGGALTGSTGWLWLGLGGAFIVAVWRGLRLLQEGGDHCPACSLDHGHTQVRRP